jgi:hypothetical protein
MIEKYLKDSITDKGRLAKIESLSTLNLIPARIYREIRRQDSLMHSKDLAYLSEKGFIRRAKDTLGIEEDDDDKESLDKIKKEAINGGSLPKDKKELKLIIRTEALLPEEKKKSLQKDSIQP